MLGVVVSYSIRITAFFAGVANGELAMLVPIKLVHPRPGKVKDYVKLTHSIMLRWHLLDLEQLSFKKSNISACY